MAPENKSNTVFIHGAPNAGKTQFLNRLNEVFKLTYYKSTRSHFDCKYRSGKIAPHFVIIEEGAFTKFFDPRDQYANAKLAFEGQGVVVETKHRSPREMFRGVPFILTANKLPQVMVEPKPRKDESEYEYRDRYNNFMAFMTRCKLHRMENSHPNSARFPYNAKELAIYMNYVMDKMDPEVE